MAEKPMGIRSLETGTCNLLDIRTTAGRKSAAAPMFCIKLDMTPTVEDMRAIILVSDLPASLMM